MSLKGNWELTIIDADPPAKELASLMVGDVDGDGKKEMIMGGAGGLLWNRPSTLERGAISTEGRFAVGLALEDIDGDGAIDVAAGIHIQKLKKVVWFKSQGGMQSPWTRHEIDPDSTGGIHDLVFVDIDGDGERELVSAAPYGDISCVYLYKRNADVTQPWNRFLVNQGGALEGTCVADVNNDGKLEILCGPEIFYMPEGGPYAGRWRRQVVAPSFREMCRTALIDISGNGKLDAVISESEYMEGKISWFENMGDEWIEHEIDKGLVYAHSLKAWRDKHDGSIHLFVAEMAMGGWNNQYNYDARIFEYVSSDNGKTWQRNLLSQGMGTHEATVCDIDDDGELEIVGKVWGKALQIPKVQIWRRAKETSPLLNYRHQFIDRHKENKGTDILAASVRGNGQRDIFCGPLQYSAPNWERSTIPGVCQVIYAYDLDRDGVDELIAVKPGPADKPKKQILNNELCWLKWSNGQWQEFPIGTARGDWPHGVVVAPLMPGGKLAMVTSYHSAHARPDNLDYPEIWEVPDDPTSGPWPKRTIAEVLYGEELRAADLNGDGLLDVVAGGWWLENKGDGTFEPHQMVSDFYAARLAIGDINGDGRPDIVLGEEVLDYKESICAYSRLAWVENPGDPREAWNVHVIDKVRCPHSVDLYDLDGDGELEVICGEHDPFCFEMRSRCRVYVYKKADPKGISWKRYILDDRFEHHDGTKVYELEPGKPAILSHGWKDSAHVHLWTLPKK